MNKELTRLLAQIDPGTNFTPQAVIKLIKTNLDLTGGMERSRFERQVFAFGDPSDLPIGHLFDHRVRMPDDLARDFLTHRNHGGLEALLLNMLCSPHSQGAALVAEALGLAPEADARLLLELHLSHPDFVRLCLSGWLGDASAWLVKAAAEDAPKLRKLLLSTALYYGALQLQLIALRQRAINEYRFAVDDGQMTHTMGALIDEQRQLIKALKKAREGVNSDKELLGRKLDVFNLLEPIGKMAEIKAYIERTDLTSEELLKELRELFEFLSPIIDALDDEDDRGDKNNAAEASGAENPTIDKASKAGRREHITTAVAGGVSSGEQIAFASLRLYALAKRLPEILVNGLPTKHGGWFERLAGNRNPHVAKLVLVNRSAVARSQYPPAYAPDGSPYDLRSTLATSANHKNKSTPNEALVRDTKKKASEWKGTGSPVHLGHGLTGCQLWDIHPEFHFDQLPCKSPRRERKPQGDEAHPHRPSPLRYAEKASHRPC